MLPDTVASPRKIVACVRLRWTVSVRGRQTEAAAPGEPGGGTDVDQAPRRASSSVRSAAAVMSPATATIVRSGR